MTPASDIYEPRNSSQTMLCKAISDYLETFLVPLDADPDVKGLPAYVQQEFYADVQCGIPAHGSLQLGLTAEDCEVHGARIDR